MKLKAIDLAVFFTLIICILATVSFESTCRDVREDILRLHVIANSDSADDQRLKLTVRDTLLEKGGAFFENCPDVICAKNIAASSIFALREIAQNCVNSQGYDYTVSVSLGKAYFPTRIYENITMPAGYYDALRIIIGKGEGKNWWCVMFPSLCLPGAYDKQERLGKVLTEREMKLVLSKPKYEVRFWLVEKYYEVKNKLKNNF